MEQNNTIKPVGLFSDKTTEKIKNIKNIIQKVAVWVFVAGVVMSAFLLLAGASSEAEIIGKTIGSLFIIGLMLIVTAYDFNKLESNNKGVQIYALIGAVMNIVWAFLWIMFLWGMFDMYSNDCIYTTVYGYKGCTRAYSVMYTLATISSSLSALGLFGACTLGIEEGDKKQVIKPLKITAIICLTYAELHSIITTITHGSATDNEMSARFTALAAFAVFIWFIAVIIAALISKNARKANEYKKNQELIAKGREAIANESATQPQAPKTEAELRAEIEERVRREMIEKEVRAKIEKEMMEKNS